MTATKSKNKCLHGKATCNICSQVKLLGILPGGQTQVWYSYIFTDHKFKDDPVSIANDMKRRFLNKNPHSKVLFYNNHTKKPIEL